MGEHKQPTKVAQKKKWDALRGVDLGHHRYIWREGTFEYPAKLYGALKSRRGYKQMRKFAKSTGLRGPDRHELMLNLMGIDE